MEQEDNRILAALRREPEQTAFLIKFSLIAASIIVAWDILAALALPLLVVKAVTVALMFCYGTMITFVVARIMLSSSGWESAPIVSPRRIASTALVQRLHSRPADPGAVTAAADDDAEGDDAPVQPSQPPPEAAPTGVFNEQYFLMRLKEQVKDARREGRQICVAALEITMPGREVSAEEIDRIAYEMARIGATQWKLIGQPLALSESEYVFSLPSSTPDESKLFVREVVQALGEYWCHFGIATFPKHATDAEGLVDKAREACEVSRQGGKPGHVEYPLSA